MIANRLPPGDLVVRQATTVVTRVSNFGGRYRNKEGTTWLGGLLQRKPARVASIAQANRTARIIWALLTRGGTFRFGGLTEIAA
jgi:transposase